MMLKTLAARIFAASVFLLLAAASASAASDIAVLTHHNNNQRWGWNAAETILTPSALSSKSSKFGVLATVSGLDSPVFAQPLVVPQLNVSCPGDQTVVTCVTGSLGVHDVVFVATVANTIYALDATTGAILLKRNFGAATGFCAGIWGTPVIDPVTSVMYVVVHTGENGFQSLKLHALHIGTLTDVRAPVSITPKNTAEALTSGANYGLDVTKICQKPALLLLGGKIYAGFTGFEYSSGNPPKGRSGPSRGWLLGWNESDLTPLAPFLLNQEAAASNSFFLTSIWMSGSGIASDGTNLYFVTGNSDPSGLSYDPVKNVEESVVEVTPELKISSLFTPFDYAHLDATDYDFGSGGVMLLPSAPPMAVAAGKDGKMFLLDGSSLGGYTPGGPDNVIAWYKIGACWCAPSFYENASGMHVVSSGGAALMTWKLWPGTAATKPKLFQDGKADLPASIEDGGFFTSVSSNGADTSVIWAVGRPTDNSGAITLYAYDGAPSKGALTLLGSYPAGTWVAYGNLLSVPVVANGKVYVASGNGLATTPTGTLTIFGLLP